MAGQIQQMINTIISKRSGGNEGIAKLTKAKLALKGVNPDKFTAQSPDDPQIMEKLRKVAQELGVTL